MIETFNGYSATASAATAAAMVVTTDTATTTPAHDVRHATRDTLAVALRSERARTLAWAEAYERALGPLLAVPNAPGLNPPLWELGHIAWFQQWWTTRNRQRALGVRCDPLHARAPSDRPHADRLYDSSNVPHATRWRLPLSDVASTRYWMAQTLEATLAQLQQLPPDASDDELYFFRLVCLHEAMHAEAATYMARSLSFEIAVPDPAGGAPLPVAATTGMTASTGTTTTTNATNGIASTITTAGCRLPAQVFTLGHEGAGFAFDNELGAHVVRIDACEIDARPVSWSRFGEFVRAGGYAQPRFPVSAAAAVHLSAYEAEAWCAWAGRRLPTEAQWECAARTRPDFEWGEVWEWTASAFEPYPGFRPHPYLDYSAPWFGGHRVLRGACTATSACMRSPRYRNFFEPSRVDVFAGFRSCA